MSESSRKDATDPIRELPEDWRLFLVSQKMKVIATAGPVAGGASELINGLDLADVLEKEGLALADVGELLVCLEDMPTECELRLRLGEPATCIVARGFEESRGISCVVLRPKADPDAERLLPAAWAWASQTVRMLGLLRPDPSNAPLQILVVDQNPEVVEFGRTLARKLGCRSSGALSGGEALAQAKARKFDLVLVDNMIPGFGPAILERLLKERGDRDWGQAPMVAAMTKDVSTLEDPEQIAIEKPISIGELKEVVQLARRQKTDPKKGGSNGCGLPVLKMDLWRSDMPLLRRLSKALVGQGSELSFKLGDKPGYSESAELLEDLKSLKNGSDILHAYRLSAACRDLLDSIHLLQTKAWKVQLENLLIEIEGFRLFAAGQGLLRD